MSLSDQIERSKAMNAGQGAQRARNEIGAWGSWFRSSDALLILAFVAVVIVFAYEVLR